MFIGKTNKLIFSEGWFIYPTTHLLTSLPLTHQFHNIRMKNTSLIFVVNVYRNCVGSYSLVCQALSTMVHLTWLSVTDTILLIGKQRHKLPFLTHAKTKSHTSLSPQSHHMPHLSYTSETMDRLIISIPQRPEIQELRGIRMTTEEMRLRV